MGKIIDFHGNEANIIIKLNLIKLKNLWNWNTVHQWTVPHFGGFWWTILQGNDATKAPPSVSASRGVEASGSSEIIGAKVLSDDSTLSSGVVVFGGEILIKTRKIRN